LTLADTIFFDADLRGLTLFFVFCHSAQEAESRFSLRFILLNLKSQIPFASRVAAKTSARENCRLPVFVVKIIVREMIIANVLKLVLKTIFQIK